MVSETILSRPGFETASCVLRLFSFLLRLASGVWHLASCLPLPVSSQRILSKCPRLSDRTSLPLTRRSSGLGPWDRTPDPWTGAVVLGMSDAAHFVQVYNMSLEDPGSVSFAGIGGLGDQVRELREVIELPLMNPELFEVSGWARLRLHATGASFVLLGGLGQRGLVTASGVSGVGRCRRSGWWAGEDVRVITGVWDWGLGNRERGMAVVRSQLTGIACRYQAAKGCSAIRSPRNR